MGSIRHFRETKLWKRNRRLRGTERAVMARCRRDRYQDELGEVVSWSKVESMDRTLKNRLSSLLHTQRADQLQEFLSSLPMLDCCRLVNERMEQKDFCAGYSYGTPLAYAISSGNLQTTSVLLNFGSDRTMIPCVPSEENDGNSSVSSSSSSLSSSSSTSSLSSEPPLRNHLHYALSQNSHSEMVWLLLDHGANMELLTELVRCSLHEPVLNYTASCKDARLARCLVQNTPQPVSFTVLPDHFNRTLLHLAVKDRNRVVVDALLNRLHQCYPGELDAQVNAVDQTGKTPLMYAVDNLDVNLVQLLLKRGADVNLPDAHGRTPLHFAVRHRSLPLVQLLLAASADAAHRTVKGLLPIDHLYHHSRWSTRRSNCTMVQVRTLPTPPPQDHGPREAAIMEALLSAPSSTLQLSREQFSHVVFRLVEDGTEDGETTLITLLQHNRQYVDLVRNGADEPLLHVAAASGKTQVLLWLLQQGGVSTRQQDDRGWLALHHACLKGDSHAVALLSFQDPDSVNKPTPASEEAGEGYTPLWLLLRYGHVELAAQCLQIWPQLEPPPSMSLNSLRLIWGRVPRLPRTLLHQGPEKNMDQARHGKRKVTALEFAKHMTYSRIVELLQSRFVNGSTDST